MALNSNKPRNEFTASAGDTDFIFNFKIFTESDLIAYLTPVGNVADDAADILTIVTDYTLVIDGDNGGTVTLVIPATDGDMVTLVRQLDITRETDYQTGGDWLAKTVNNDQDYQTYLTQQNDANNARNLTLSESAQGINTAVPAPIPQWFLKANASGNGFEWQQGTVQVQNEFDTSVFRLFSVTSKISFSASLITAGQTRVATMPDYDILLGGIKDKEIDTTGLADGYIPYYDLADDKWKVKTESTPDTRLNISDEDYAGQNAGEEILKQNGSWIKNQCTSWAYFDNAGSIIDAFNIASINNAGGFNVTFSASMSNTNYTIIPYANYIPNTDVRERYRIINKTVNGFTFIPVANNGFTATNWDNLAFHIIGGR